MVSWLLFAVSLYILPGSTEHHMKHHIEERQNGGSNSVPLLVANWCSETIYPAVITQNGNGPSTSGFQLNSGANQTLSVASNWQGRVWGRTNCSFNSNGQGTGNNGAACSTGDCGGALQCRDAGAAPATLAEFTLAGSSSQTFYDISMVDGYNLPLAIMLLSNGNSNLQKLSPNQTNPSCVASVGDLAAQTFNPYSGGQQFLGTSSQFPLSFEVQNTDSAVADWCPWDLQVNAPLAPGNGVYPYPDTNVARPPFDPCLSACAKYNQDSYCCTGHYDSPGSCSPNYYSKAAKTMCPDAYSYAYDDQTSTFIVPQGGGFQVIFCPGGRSTNIIATKAGAMSNSASSGPKEILKLGWLVIDARALKATLAASVLLVVLSI